MGKHVSAQVGPYGSMTGRWWPPGKQRAERCLAAGRPAVEDHRPVGLSTLLALVVAIPMGVVQAVRRNKVTDHVLNTTSTVFYATPDFLIGIVGIMLFAIAIPLFPPGARRARARARSSRTSTR
jgi:ABC-type Fe3+ transport system permease subunit